MSTGITSSLATWRQGDRFRQGDSAFLWVSDPHALQRPLIA
jgi:hypothetical protein